MPDHFKDQFDQDFRHWAEMACKEWGFPEPSIDFFEKCEKRQPLGVRATIGFGLLNGIVIVDGYKFTLKGLQPHKGPYKWFSRYSSESRPNPNWEYYIQVAEYIRLWQAFESSDHTLTFEDSLMDIGIYKNNKLLVCCEIKEKSSQAEKLIKGIKSYEKGIDLTAPDRGNDPLRKAKYIVRNRPQYFYLVAVGRRFEFSVSFPEGKAFKLTEDIIPFV